MLVEDELVGDRPATEAEQSMENVAKADKMNRDIGYVM